eukprot:gnl/MRDRNA2_/MRDRNA2_109639_c0_seq1.p1 gnl/MRDRNA2_/MRDRNA2_109639_c0~~gnl/MRDRNA2_/MRDRNA2_109639_c0_seq1.p1  ORF type:complete len:426 (-),score=73.48 gnl/MRDRNA2_/MRDRNA2_109639_c0_seq1:59-1336(-)
MACKPKPWDVEQVPLSMPMIDYSRSEPCLKLQRLGQPKALDTRTNALPARAMSPLEILEASRSTLETFDPTGRWYRPDAADDYHMSGASDINKWRAQQSDLYADLDAKVAARKTKKAKKFEQHVERTNQKKAYLRTLKHQSMGAVRQPWTYCDGPDFCEPPIIDSSPSRNSVKNHFLTGIWNGLEGEKPVHHECNVYGGWNYSQTDSCKGVQGTFQPVPAKRMSSAEKRIARTLEQNLKDAKAKASEDARKATSGIEKRQAIQANAEKFSAISGEARPWITQSVATHTVFGKERPLVASCKPGVDIYLDGDTKNQVATASRAHDHSRNFISGSEGPSFWRAPPAGALVGTRRRRDLVDALVNRSRSVPGVSQRSSGLQVTFKDPAPHATVTTANKKLASDDEGKPAQLAQFGAEVNCQVIDVGTL